jgi:hypothetical protein
VGIFILKTLKIRYMPVFFLFTLGRHGNFTAGVTLEQPDLLCTALALNIVLLSIIMCAFYRRHIRIIVYMQFVEVFVFGYISFCIYTYRGI